MGEAAYSLAKEVDWNKGLHLQATGVLSLEALMAIDEIIIMVAWADPVLLQAEADAHHGDISSTSGPNGIASEAY